MLLLSATIILASTLSGHPDATPLSISSAGTWDGLGYQHYAASIVVSGNHAYVGHAAGPSTKGSLSILDISNPATPRRLGEYPIRTGESSANLPPGPTWVALAGARLHGLSEGGVFMVLDPVQPTAPRLLGSMALSGPVHALATRVVGTNVIAHVAAGASGLMLIDARDTTRLRIAGVAQNLGDIRAVAVTERLALVGTASGRLDILDTSQVSHPLPIGTIQLAGEIRSVRVRAPLALVAHPTTGLTLVDLAVPERPRVVWLDDRPGRAMDAAFGIGNLAAYVVDGHSTGASELRLLDLSDASRPTRLNTHAWARQPFSVIWSGSRVYVTEEMYMGPSGFQIFELGLPIPPDPPRVVAEPDDLFVIPAGSATLSAMIDGTPPLRFQWERPDANRTWQPVPGASNTWLLRTPVGAGDAGPYRLLAMNSAGSVTSRVATLHVPAPALVTHVRLENAAPWPPYDTWESAATNLQHAVDFTLPGGTILVSEGVYRTGATPSNGLNRVVLGKPVLLHAVGGPSVTMIQGARHSDPRQAIRCAFVGDGATVSGFTLANGAGLEGGGGAWCGPLGRLTNCIVSSNAAVSPFAIRGVSAGGVSGGTLVDCLLIGNTATTGGGAHASRLERCALRGNQAYGIIGRGGGAAQSTLIDCLLVDNRSSQGLGGGVYDSTLTNCHLVANQAEIGGGSSHSRLRDCVVVENLARSDPQTYQSVCVNSLFFPGPAPENDNRVGDPRFLDAAAGDYRLRPDSPCIDSGTSARSPAELDLAGDPRRLDGNGDGSTRVDLGSFEFDPLPPRRLRIQGGATGIRLEWKPIAPGGRLQRSPRLSPAEWQDLPGSTGARAADLVPAVAAEYFRLRGP